MTPCEEHGYKVGQTFKYIGNDCAFSKGSIVRLYRDDGSFEPLFKLESGSTPYKHADGMPGDFAHLSFVVPCGPAKPSLREDLSVQLDQISRAWIRLPLTVFFTPFIAMPAALIEGIGAAGRALLVVWDDIVVPCWKGPDR